MFSVHQMVYYGSNGICLIDDVTENPFDGAPKGVLYYVMHTVSEPKQIIFSPVNMVNSLLRPILSREEAESVLDDIPSLTILSGVNAKQLREQYQNSLKTYLPLEWGRVILTYYQRQSAALNKRIHTTEAEKNYYDVAMTNLCKEFSYSLQKSDNEIRELLLNLLEKIQNAFFLM